MDQERGRPWHCYGRHPKFRGKKGREGERVREKKKKLTRRWRWEEVNPWGARMMHESQENAAEKKRVERRLLFHCSLNVD
jgi:hypothetical protein